MVEFCGISKEFHGNTVVEDVCLKFEEGRIYGRFWKRWGLMRIQKRFTANFPSE